MGKLTLALEALRPGSAVQTCRVLGLSTRDYLIDVITRLEAGWPARRLTELLPTAGRRFRTRQGRGAVTVNFPETGGYGNASRNPISSSIRTEAANTLARNFVDVWRASA